MVSAAADTQSYMSLVFAFTIYRFITTTPTPTNARGGDDFTAQTASR